MFAKPPTELTKLLARLRTFEPFDMDAHAPIETLLPTTVFAFANPAGGHYLAAGIAMGFAFSRA